MGTRSLTHIKTEGTESKTFLTLYRQSDGYPEGHGKDVASFLASKKMVNRYQDSQKEFNGLGCAAAQLISHLKGERAGNIYIYEADINGCGEEFTYTIYRDKKDVFYLRCEDGAAEVLYDGPVTDFSMWLKNTHSQAEA